MRLFGQSLYALGCIEVYGRSLHGLHPGRHPAQQGHHQ
jgi:hypothetical protein